MEVGTESKLQFAVLGSRPWAPTLSFQLFLLLLALLQSSLAPLFPKPCLVSYAPCLGSCLFFLLQIPSPSPQAYAHSVSHMYLLAVLQDLGQMPHPLSQDGLPSLNPQNTLAIFCHFTRFSLFEIFFTYRSFLPLLDQSCEVSHPILYIFVSPT